MLVLVNNSNPSLSLSLSLSLTYTHTHTDRGTSRWVTAFELLAQEDEEIICKGGDATIGVGI